MQVVDGNLCFIGERCKLLCVRIQHSLVPHAYVANALLVFGIALSYNDACMQKVVQQALARHQRVLHAH